MFESLDFHPVAVGRNHAVTGDVVNGCAPEHRLFAAGIFGDIAADGGAVCTGRVYGENVIVKRGGFCYAPSYRAAARVDHGHKSQVAFGQVNLMCTADRIELFCIDHRTHLSHRHGTSCVSGAAAARNDHQAELNAGAYQRWNFSFAVGGDHHKRIFDTQVRGVGDMRGTHERVKTNVVGRRAVFERAFETSAERFGTFEA